jgi:hypothetical protein
VNTGVVEGQDVSVLQCALLNGAKNELGKVVLVVGLLPKFKV